MTSMFEPSWGPQVTNTVMSFAYFALVDMFCAMRNDFFEMVSQLS